MDKFWKWMEKKNYGNKHRRLFYCDRVQEPEQMLIGYKIEYLIEKQCTDALCVHYSMETGESETITDFNNFLNERISSMK